MSGLVHNLLSVKFVHCLSNIALSVGLRARAAVHNRPVSRYVPSACCCTAVFTVILCSEEVLELRITIAAALSPRNEVEITIRTKTSGVCARVVGATLVFRIETMAALNLREFFWNKLAQT